MNYKYDFASSTHSLQSRCAYWKEWDPLLRMFGKALPAEYEDLLELAVAVYAADCCSKRYYRDPETGQRHINLQIGINDPERWCNSKVNQVLHRLLSWMSGDLWDIQFQKCHAMPRQLPLSQMHIRKPVMVSLFSGGLDSFAGFFAHAENPVGSYVLLAGDTRNQAASTQRRKQVNYIKNEWNRRCGESAAIHYVSCPFGLAKPRADRREQSQRTRALVFLALGIVSALLAGTNMLWVYENGIGALNLPLNATQLGVDNYRGVHPVTLIMVEELISLALDQPIQISNPFLFSTKSEMCRIAGKAGFVGGIKHTFSCDGFPQRCQQRQCGICTSCIFRRISLHASGLEKFDLDNLYRYDIMKNRNNINGKKIHDLEVMRHQVQRIAHCLNCDQTWHSLVAPFPELARTCKYLVTQRGLSSDEVTKRIIQLYQTYVNEWRHLPESIRLIF